MQLLVFAKIQNADKDNLYRAKVEGQITFGKHAAEFGFVCIGIVENFDNFGYDSAVEKDGAYRTEVLFSQKDKQDGGENYTNADAKQVL